MLSSEQEKAIRKLAKIEKGLLNGASLTFAVDNIVETMKADEGKKFVQAIHSLIEKDILVSHSDKETPNNVPFWLEFTRQGREYCNRIS